MIKALVAQALYLLWVGNSDWLPIDEIMTTADSWPSPRDERHAKLSAEELRRNPG